MTSIDSLTWGHFLTITVVLAVAVLLAGVVVIVGRSRLGRRDPASSLVRSWIAISLVIGLLLFGAASLALEDAELRSTLVGALAANVGAAVAFYFASKSADQAREDILNATFGTEQVPDLTGKDMDEASALLGRTTLRLEGPADLPAVATVIATQNPLKDTTVRRGSRVLVTLKPPSPAGDSPAAGAV